MSMVFALPLSTLTSVTAPVKGSEMLATGATIVKLSV